jgi:probable HAF family extracellular repeat protein
MPFRTLLRGLRWPPARPHARGFRHIALAVERLEERCVPSYTFTDLGNLDGYVGEDSQALGINTRQSTQSIEVVGYSIKADSGASEAVLWEVQPTGVQINDLGTLGGVGSQATAINNSSVSAGWAYLPNNTTDHAVTWYLGSITDLGSLTNGESRAYGINNPMGGSIVVGYTYVASGGYHAFYYDTSMHDIGTLGGTYSIAYGINDNAQIVGMGDVAGDAEHAFLYQSHQMTDLGTLGGTESSALAINKSGVIVGWSQPTSSTNPHAFRYSGTTMTDLGTFGGPTSQALAINNNGVIVGSADATDGSHRAFIYSGGVMTDLNTLITNLPSNEWVSFAAGINDNGQIVGTVYLPYGPPGSYASHACLLTPNTGSSPASATTFAVGSPLVAQILASSSMAGKTSGMAQQTLGIAALPGGAGGTATATAVPLGASSVGSNHDNDMATEATFASAAGSTVDTAHLLSDDVLDLLAENLLAQS